MNKAFVNSPRNTRQNNIQHPYNKQYIEVIWGLENIPRQIVQTLKCTLKTISIFQKKIIPNVHI